MERRKAQAAPEKLFPGRFPEAKNGFRPGMKLEAIDPEHQSLFCVMTVAEVKGIFFFLNPVQLNMIFMNNLNISLYEHSPCEMFSEDVSKDNIQRPSLRIRQNLLRMNLLSE